METTELLRKVRKIEIKTRGLSSHIFSGEYHSAFKGRGMAFSEVREYMPGDDIRTIDWNVTARFGHPFVKVFEEERELTVMLLVDLSASGEFGTREQFKKDLLIELCAVLSFSAIQNNDKIGLIFFTDKIEKFIPPKKGKTHILRIIRELINFEPQNRQTNISEALRYVVNVIKKKSICFVISDFMDDNFEDALKLANKKHDVVALRVYDPFEQDISGIGLVRMRDSETGEIIVVDTGSSGFKKGYVSSRLRWEKELKETFAKCGVDQCSIRTNESYVKPLMNLFKRRGRK
ncbi:MAG: DUF58 domain-containing protein [Bacteroidetes bacterium]|nr:MAG: DUF58 domain-containing protein [Bacteroidota bacterium]REK08170.1 MAG: DUF58 domain-containing protein [Bacteroidota bacterium]REK32375.1 MAG: DUF58 domain-containing protein [Bacteroidota bacterium]REK49609.1 MAG: DUF58 domain-containing protein [Bacteroidota bacterium]